MRSHLRPVLQQTARTARNLASQVVVAVITGVSVGLITNAIIERTNGPEAPASAPAPTASASHSLPALQPVVIRDVPAPLSRAPAANADKLAPLAGAGLYFAAKAPTGDPFRLLVDPFPLPPA